MRKVKKAKEKFYQGNVDLEKGDFLSAKTNYNIAIKSGFKEPKVYNNLALAEKGSGQVDKAQNTLNKAIQLDPEFPEPYNNLGNILTQKNDLLAAIDAYERAIEINPYYKEAFNNLGTAWQTLGDLKKAIIQYKKALKIDPDYDGALNNIGVAYYTTGELTKSVKMLKKSVEISPNYISSYYNLSITYQDMNKPLEAIKACEEAVDIYPDYQDAVNNLAQLYKNVCDWKNAKKYKMRLDELTKIAIDNKFRPGETPFYSISNYEDNRRNLQVATLWSNSLSGQVSVTKPKFSYSSRKNKKTINIGYLSSDFRNHAIGHQMMGVFKHHDKKKFKVHVYSYGPDDASFYRKEIKKHADIFRDIDSVGYIETARIINKDKIDILIDVNGHTKGARLQIPALRPAPIQATYLGFPGSTGASFIDYAIVDKMIVPKKVYKQYNEKLVNLPNCYQVSSYKGLKKSKTKTTRKQVSLPEDAIVFCNFNKSYKIERNIFESWLRILKKTPGSVLWLLDDGSEAKKNLVQKAKSKGVPKNRLIFAKQILLEKHLKRLALANIALDTKPYNGGATTSNALWVGVPVVTIEGTTYISRMSSSILSSLGLPELVSKDIKSYETLAIRIGKNKDELSRIKGKLLKAKTSAVHFNTESFTKDIEEAYEIMWDKHLKHKKPVHITVK